MQTISLNQLSSSGLTALPPLALYIHFPWCVRKCPYCDFNSHAVKDANYPSGLPEEQYIAALISDLESNLPQVWGRSVSSIFMGGGTPSLFSAASMDKLLEAIRARVKLNPDAEITLEANPGTFEIEKFAGYAAAGINRLSIGIQSFNPEHLSALGRIHNRDEALRAVEIAHQHFNNFNLDIMYALPKQTLAQAQADIRLAIECNSTHLSAYHLTLEPNTLFHRYPPALPDDDLAADMQEMIEAELASAGFEHYETSAFAKAGKRSQHNLNYWQFGDYLGIGAGAHGKISFHDKIIRQARYKQPTEYLTQMASGNAIQSENVVEKSELPFEFMLNLLRLTEGFPLALFTERTGLPQSKIFNEIERACSEGLLERDLHWVKPSIKGQRFLNVLMERFLP
ncbi:oxygen-independent coproporphyrinogen III oxidase-like protein [Chitinibacter bivalviorum]|uniref:Heme chaperone HemW n=1 Tax=Chitinibacter bivalviorum TaxID=2739434 RepID=A0A7H9BGR5_9NEIS|nr:radical SAM family heme chaperone HemW [Chitinibacter bivalviorum]QLG87807.1 oxygen-independent coproporphyrinogen III oxidase-like protein [Chitinibacter bivalviorum]